MNSTIIHKSTHYTACHMQSGMLIVQSNRTQKGIALTGNEAAKWLDAITTAIDSTESAAICRAILNQ